MGASNRRSQKDEFEFPAKSESSQQLFLSTRPTPPPLPSRTSEREGRFGLLSQLLCDNKSFSGVVRVRAASLLPRQSIETISVVVNTLLTLSIA